MSSVDGQVAAFYALGGDTVNEIAKSFSIFQNNLQLDELTADAFFRSIQPQNFRQELLRLKLLRKFHRDQDLFQALLKGSKIITKLALRDPGLIKLLGSMESGELINRVFEEFSFTTRTQLINKLSFSIKDDSKGLELYKAVLNKYGMKAANPLLIACGEEVIIEGIEENEVKFRHRQLMHCYKKSHKLLEVYFKKNPVFNDHPKIGRYLCMHDVDTFHNLLKYGVPNIGKNALINYLRKYKKEFARDSDKLRPLLKNSVLSKCLGEEEFVELIKNLLPKNITDYDFGWELETSLKVIPHKMRGRVLFAAFRKLYGFDIWSNQDYISNQLLEMLALEDRRKFDLANYIEYESTEKSIPILEHRLSLTSQKNERITIMRNILENCKVNQDYGALLGVLKKFTKYQKNEHKNFRHDFIDFITYYFNLEKFSDEHWKYIDEIIMQFHINDEYVYVVGNTLTKYIEYKIKHGLDYTLQLKLYCKHRGVYEMPIFSKKPEEQREVIVKYHSLIDEVSSSEEEKKIAHITFITAALKFNLQHMQERAIKLFDYKDSVEAAVENIKEKYPQFFYLRKLLKCLYKEGEKVDDLLKHIFIATSIKHESLVQCWFLWKKPGIIENNLEILFQHKMLNSRFCYELSKLENTNLKNKVVEYAVKALKNSKDRDAVTISNSFKILSFCPEIDLEEYMKPWLPTEYKIDVHKEDIKNLLVIQKDLILSYKNSTCLQEAIQKVVLFCNGDYLQYALDPLYHISYNVPERDLINPLNELLKRSVSVRKHAIHLVIHLTSLEFKRATLKNLVEIEQNASIKRFIVKKLCKCLQNDRSETDWDLFSSNLNFVDSEDKEIITELMSAKEIPKAFYTKFIHLLWSYLSEKGKFQEFQLIDTLDYKKFAFDDSCKAIISSSLLNPENKYMDQTYTFMLNYLLSSSNYESQDKKKYIASKVEFIWECLKNSYKGFEPFKFQKTVHDFFFAVCKQILQKKSESKISQTCASLEIIDTMHALLPSLKIKHPAFQIRLLLETTNMYASTDTLVFTKYIADKFKSLLDEFGPLIIGTYAAFIKQFLILVLEEKFDCFILDFIEGALKRNISTEFNVFCVNLLPQSIPKHAVLRDKYFNVMKMLEEDTSNVVCYELEKHLLGLTV